VTRQNLDHQTWDYATWGRADTSRTRTTRRLPSILVIMVVVQSMHPPLCWCLYCFSCRLAIPRRSQCHMEVGTQVVSRDAIHIHCRQAAIKLSHFRDDAMRVLLCEFLWTNILSHEPGNKTTAVPRTLTVFLREWQRVTQQVGGHYMNPVHAISAWYWKGDAWLASFYARPVVQVYYCCCCSCCQ